MAQRKKIATDAGPGTNPDGIWYSSYLPQITILLTGVILTVVAFAILNIFIQGQVSEEHSRITQSAADVLIEGTANLRRSVHMAATILSLPEEYADSASRSGLAKQVRDVAPSLNRFDQVIWLYETRPGIWQFNNVYLRTSSGHQTIVPNRVFISHIVKSNFFAHDKVHTITDFPGLNFSKNQETKWALSNPFAVVKAVKVDDSSAGIVIGFSRIESVLGQSWLEKSAILSQITVRDADNAKRIYYRDYSQESNRKASAIAHSYEYMIGESKWSATLEFFNNQEVGMLKKMPLMVIAFGLILTMVGTMYVHNSQSQSSTLTAMNRQLEQKNLELKTEVGERERLNKVIRRAEKENRAIINSVTDIIFEVSTDGKILFLNNTWHKITGFTPKQSVGHDLFSMLHPQDQEQQRQDFQLLVHAQKQTYRAFTRLRMADGTFRSVEMAMSMIHRDESKRLRVVGTFTDVEERRRAERALAEAEKKYRTIVEHAAGGIYQLTPEGIYLAVNPAMARVLGYESREEIVRVNANDAVYVDKEEREAFRQKLEERGVISNYETQVRKKDGTHVWINENARLVRDETGHVLYYEGSIEDITQRKQAEMALREAKHQSDIANRAKSEFLANMSHELRTPLNAIIGFSEIIKNEVLGPVGQKAYWEYARDIYDSGKGLLTIINEILDIAKIESGDRQLNDSVVDMSEIVATAMDIIASKAGSGYITVTNNTQDMPNVIGEALALKQVALNLLSNAVKFTPNGGSVTISSEIDGQGQLRLSFTDTGIGLSEEEIEKALSPFGQIDNALDREGSGTGLGLTLVNSMMLLHDGKLEIFSEKSVGTTAAVVFPAERVSPKKEEKKKQQDSDEPSDHTDLDDMEGADVF
ncbi:MAG: hypothetical protein DHS20C02_11410 [Micavibrio sp.]|nr:MAG: hypothetical protein DHS20C02_11410 [Micavibrio sp.]